jgi:microcystin-dependent protein
MSYFAFAPTGTITIYNNLTPPEGWLFCDGTAVSRISYASLWNAIGTAWGSGDGVSTFNIPNLQGVLLRGRDNGAGRDTTRNNRTTIAAGGATGDNVGSYQIFSVLTHTHGITSSLPDANMSHSHSIVSANTSHGHNLNFGGAGDHSHTADFKTRSQRARVFGDTPDDVVDQDPVQYIARTPSYDVSYDHYASANLSYAYHYHSIGYGPDTGNTHFHSVTVNISNSGNSDSRPINAAAAYIIKF